MSRQPEMPCAPREPQSRQKENGGVRRLRKLVRRP